MIANKTYIPKPNEVTAKWIVVDAADKIVGRLARDIAMVLMGKHRPTYTPHVDTGDFVIVINAEKVAFTGRKWEGKVYTWKPTAFPGQKSETAGNRLKRRPELIIHEAVRRMLPKNKLYAKVIKKLKIYTGPQHPHQAQQPELTDLGVKQ